MAAHFSATTRSLERRGPMAVTIAIGLGGVLVLAIWVAWFLEARVGMYVSTDKARLEVAGMVHRVASPEEGRVVAVSKELELGRTVEADDVLLELDTTVERQQLAESEVRLAVCAAKKEALNTKIDAERHSQGLQVQLDSATVRRAQADVAQLELDAKYEKDLQAISERLHAEQLASTRDLLGAKRDTDDVRSRAVAAEREVHRLSAAQAFDVGKASATIADLERQLVDLDADARLAAAAVDTASAQIERRRIRAPVRGKLGDIAALQVGDVVKAADVIATIVPAEDIHAVAEFSPSDAVGRVMPGQKARLRLTGFAWTHYGAIDATVSRVASEPRDGVVRVELQIRAGAAPNIPIQHGLPGSAEIEIGRVAPWWLVMQSLTPGAPDAPSGSPVGATP